MRNTLEAKHPKQTERGFTLIEIAITLVIVGIMGGGILMLYNMAEKQRTTDITSQNMRIIVEALSTFVESAGRLPCPADPGRNDDLFGWEWGVTTATIAAGRPLPPVTCRTWGAGADPGNVGIVPFLTLGLPEEVTRDAWGRYFTYAVSPVFAQDNDDVNPGAARGDFDNSDDQGRVHAKCLDGAWYDNEDNVNSVKAKFCCAKDGDAAPFLPATDINIVHTDGNPIHPNPAGEFYERARDATAGNYVLVDPYRPNPQDNDSPYVYIPNVDAGGKRQVGTLQSENAEANLAAPAFVLISHGDNGDGAFLANGTRNIFNSGAASILENENLDFDNTFAIGPLDETRDATYFDDIVVWRTQEGIMAENGSSSCGYP